MSKDIKKEFKLYLREIADERKFGMYILDVQLPLGNEAFISKHGTASVFVNGTFEVVMDMNVSTECIRDIVGGALDRALDAVYQSSDYLSACDSYRDEIFINQRNLGVYATVHVAVVIEATLDDDSEIDREKLFTLINKRGADDCWYSELDRYLNSTRLYGLEIGYR